MAGKDLVPRPAVLPPAVLRPPWQPDKEEFVPAWRWIWQRRHWTAPAALVPALWLAGLGAAASLGDLDGAEAGLGTESYPCRHSALAAFARPRQR